MLDTIDKIFDLQEQRDELFKEYYRLNASKNDFDFSIKKYVLDEIILINDDLKEIETEMGYQERVQKDFDIPREYLRC